MAKTGCTLAVALALFAGCAEEPSTLDAGAIPQAPSASPETSAPAAESAEATAAALDASGFRGLIEKISEPNAEFFSDNFISNETSYLQVSQQLLERDKDNKTRGVYIGVGPEQNFSYIAHTRPTAAYIVDIRRDNMILQLLYKAAFDVATDRAHFLALLTGRPYDDGMPLPEDGSIEDVLSYAERGPASLESYNTIHAQLKERIEKDYGFALDAGDAKSLNKSHRSFWRDGVDIRFQLKEKSFRKYPSLRELVSAEDQHGNQLGFLTTHDAFAFVQTMQRENRIVPLVGDFAGERALPSLANHLTEQGQVVDYFYVSNVEQYLMQDGVWWKWQRNIAALPIDDQSAFIRCYLDQGKRHPNQMTGHRTATTLHLISDFNARKKRYPSFHALASDKVID